MKSCFRVVIILASLAWGWIVSDARAQDDLVAKAHSERQRAVYGTALARSSVSSSNLSSAATPSSKPSTHAPRGEAITTKILQESSARQLSADAILINNYASDQGQKEVLSMDKPPALPKFQPAYLRGIHLFPADWTLSDSYEEYNKTYREIFWK